MFKTCSSSNKTSGFINESPRVKSWLNLLFPVSFSIVLTEKLIFSLLFFVKNVVLLHCAHSEKYSCSCCQWHVTMSCLWQRPNKPSFLTHPCTMITNMQSHKGNTHNVFIMYSFNSDHTQFYSDSRLTNGTLL